MAKTTKVKQSKWVKGVNAAAQAFAQPPGSFPRASNLVFTSRGALKTSDGSLIDSAFGGGMPLQFFPLTSRSWRELFYFSPSGSVNSGIYGLLEDPNVHFVSTVGTPTLVGTSTGLTGTYYIEVTALDGVGGESAASPEVSITVANQSIKVTWAAVPNAFGYNVYVGTASGAEVLALPTGASPFSIGPTVSGQATVTFTFTATSVLNSAQVPPTTDTSQQLSFLGVPSGGYSIANIIKEFPPSQIVARVPSPVGIFNSAAPVLSSTQIRPTAFAAGGPNGGSHGFGNPALAYDNNFATFSEGIATHSGGGAEETWSGFPSALGGIVALTLNVNLSTGVNDYNSLINYSLDGGVTWSVLASPAAGTPQQTFSTTLPNSQNLANVKVDAYTLATPSTPFVPSTMNVYEIWISATVQLSSGASLSGGGTVGVSSSIPEILQFRDLMILLLGNGLPPYSSDGTTAGTILLTNAFQASYASRVASTPQNVGDQISATVGATAYIFTCTQAGTTSSGGAPAFSAVQSSIVVDGTVYWKNTGSVAGVTAPRGAAHGIVYSGSLWVGNTYPTTTSDNFDGPSCLKMSDLNNPNSWNPLNVAFLDRDDGTSITGMATFTIAEAGISPTGSLVVFKDFSTFQVNGVFGASNFSIQRAQTDMGCMVPRTIQFVPGLGIVRLTHLGFAVFDGVRDRLLSEEIRPYLFGGRPDITPIDWPVAYFSKGTQCTSPPMYIAACPLVGAGASLLGALTGITAGVAVPSPGPPTLSTGAYYIRVSLRGPNGESALSAEIGPLNVVAGTNGITVNAPAVPTGYDGYRAYFGIGPGGENQYVDFNAASVTIIAPGNAGTPPTGFGGLITRLFCYDLVLKAWTIIDLPFAISVLQQFRPPAYLPFTLSGGSYDTTVRRLFGGDLTWDGTPVTWNVRTPEVFGKDASDRVYFRQLEIRGVGSPTGMTATITINGVTGLNQITRNLTVTPMGGGEFVAYADIGATGVDAYATISGSGPIEIQSVDWACIPKAIRGRVTV